MSGMWLLDAQSITTNARSADRNRCPRPMLDTHIHRYPTRSSLLANNITSLNVLRSSLNSMPSFVNRSSDRLVSLRRPCTLFGLPQQWLSVTYLLFVWLAISIVLVSTSLIRVRSMSWLWERIFKAPNSPMPFALLNPLRSSSLFGYQICPGLSQKSAQRHFIIQSLASMKTSSESVSGDFGVLS